MKAEVVPSPQGQSARTDAEDLAEIERLYRQAFAEHGAIALWSSRQAAHPTVADAMAITATLRREGDMKARRLAERIERLCNAAR